MKQKMGKSKNRKKNQRWNQGTSGGPRVPAENVTLVFMSTDRFIRTTFYVSSVLLRHNRDNCFSKVKGQGHKITNTCDELF